MKLKGLRVQGIEILGFRVAGFGVGTCCYKLGDRIRGTLGDMDSLNKVPFKRAISRVKKSPLEVLPRTSPTGSRG